MAQTDNDLTAALIAHVRKDSAILAKIKAEIEYLTVDSDTE